jgi:tetratricopeptide (TPR) repeat protein
VNELKCPHCQAENREGVKFCRKCGKSFTTELKCPNCNHINLEDSDFCEECGHSLVEQPVEPTRLSEPSKLSATEPTSFADGRFQVKKKLGEGGKKKVYLVYDKKLDRDVAIYLIKTEKLDETGRTRILREAQAMARLGDHPNIASIHELGDHEGQPYMVAPLISGGDVEALIEKAPDHKLPLDKTIEIAKAVCKGLEFAHSKGIIHRDIKPGNVMLSADGTAKINDFGLAMALDVSRLTQEGLMVGTASYMPPEQAGGEVTSKADLYSLGAMLYEMVTGRPPFIGDDYVAVVTQHLNNQPISPTWHRADLPPAFESLIMMLLEKDPDKRPNSAKDVLQALESIEKGELKETTIEQKTPTENPIYRRIFVGRENELKQLQNSFTGAMSGQGALIMVVGEPGIGKTAICEQLATYATLQGGQTLWGHCYEEGSLSLPYLAFVEAMRSYVLDRDPGELKKEMGSGASDVARIVSEVREKLQVEPRETINPDEDRYRLMQAVTSFLANAATVKPILVILEDLHDADKGTLEMLSHVSRNLGGKRLLLIGTYRDVEVDRSHPLSAALAELRRVSSFGRVLLRGLNIDEVRRMLESLTQENIPVGLAEAVHRQTEGNPLFVQEVVRYLTEEKLLTRETGRLQSSEDTALEMSIPEGLRDVIGKRLSNLSPECNELLSVASVIGREFALDTLKAVVDMDDAVFINVLKEAIQLSILEERSQVGVIRYRFTHAFFRQTLYEELIAPQRLKLHQQVARSMEKLYEKRLEEHASELAEHFSQSTDQANLLKAIEYGKMAARKAVNVYAYSEAVRLYDQAIKVQRVLDPDDKENMCDLLLEICDVLLSVPDTNRIIEIEAPAALSLAENMSDNARASKACVTALYAISLESGGEGFATPVAAQWAEQADRYARSDTPERALADTFLGFIKCLSDMRSGIQLIEQAFELARCLDDPYILIIAGGVLLLLRSAPQNAKENIKIAEELLSHLSAGSAKASMNWQLIGHTFLMMGDRQRAEEVNKKIRTMASRTGNFQLELNSVVADAIMTLLDGRLEETMDLARNIRDMGKEVGMIGGANMLAMCSDFYARIHLGKSLENLESTFRALPVAMGDQAYQTNAIFCVVLAYLGKRDEVTEYLNRFVLKPSGVGTIGLHSTSFIAGHYLTAAVLTKNREASEKLMNYLAGTAVVTTGMQQPTCIPRHLGGAATLLERYDDAREHYKQAIRVCTEMRFRPELALTHLNFAELLLDHYPKEKAEALEHLDFAIKEFRAMKMQPSLERALRRKDILKA